MPDEPVILGPWQYATGGLAIALALSLAWGARIDHLRAAHAAAHAQTKRDYKNAQDEAQAAFNVQIAALQAYNRRLNDEADRKSNAVSIVYRDRVVRLPAAPAGCAASGADLSTSGDAARSDRSGGDAVVLSRSDTMICAINTARLEAAREWAIGMEAALFHVDRPATKF